jgi:hypothetical protein
VVNPLFYFSLGGTLGRRTMVDGNSSLKVQKVNVYSSAAPTDNATISMPFDELKKGIEAAVHVEH